MAACGTRAGQLKPPSLSPCRRHLQMSNVPPCSILMSESAAMIPDDVSASPSVAGTPAPVPKRTHARRNRRRAPFSSSSRQSRRRAPTTPTVVAGSGVITHVRGRNDVTGELVVLVDTGAGAVAQQWELMDQRRLERRVAAQLAAGHAEPTYAVRSVPRLRARNVIPGSPVVARFVKWEGYDDHAGVWVAEKDLLAQGVLCAGCAQFECRCAVAM